MKPEELQQRVDQAIGFIQALTQECHVLDERRHILVPLIFDSEIKQALRKKLDKTTGAGAWNHMVPMLGQDLLRDQARLFLDDDKRSASLTNLWRKLNFDPVIKAHFRDAYGRMFDDLHTGTIEGISAEGSAAIMGRFKQRDRDENYALFDKSWGMLEIEMAALSTDTVAAKIKTFRDKRHAHFEMQKLDEEPKPFDVDSLGLTFGDVLEFGDRCQALVANLGLLLTGTSWDPRQFSEGHAKQGVDMWKRLAN